MSRQQRAIDVLADKPRERPMEVLCLGLSRTATMCQYQPSNDMVFSKHLADYVGSEPSHA